MLPKKKRWMNAIQHTSPMVAATHLGQPSTNDSAMKAPVSPQIQLCQSSPVGSNTCKPVPATGGHYQPLNTFGMESAASATGPKHVAGGLHQGRCGSNTAPLRPPTSASEPTSTSEIGDPQPSLLLQIPREYLANLLRIATSGRNDLDLSTIFQLTEASGALKGVLNDQYVISQLASGNIRIPYHPLANTTMVEHCSGPAPISLVPSASKQSPSPPKSSFATSGNRAFPASRSRTGSQSSEPLNFCNPISPGVQRFSPHRRPSSGSNDHLSLHQSPSASRAWIHGQEHSSGIVKTGSVLAPSRSSPTDLVPSWETHPSNLLPSLGNGIIADRMQCTSDTAAYTIALGVSGNNSNASALDVGMLSTPKPSNASDYPIRPKSSLDASCLAGSTSRSHPALLPLSQSGQPATTCHKPGIPSSSFDLANRVCFPLPGDHSTGRSAGHPQRLATWMSPPETQVSEAPGCSTSRGLDNPDSRLAILQDAKMTALSVGWPNASGAQLNAAQSITLGTNSSPKLSTNSGKGNNRMRHMTQHASTTCFSTMSIPGLVSTSPISLATPSRLLSTSPPGQRFPSPHLSMGRQIVPPEQEHGTNRPPTACCTSSAGKHPQYYHHMPIGQSGMFCPAGLAGNASRFPSGENPNLSGSCIPAPLLSPSPQMRQVSGGPAHAPPSHWHLDRAPSATQLRKCYVEQSHPGVILSPNADRRSPKLYPQAQVNSVHSISSSSSFSTTHTTNGSSNANHWLRVSNPSSDPMEHSAPSRPQTADSVQSTPGGVKPSLSTVGAGDCFTTEARSVISLKKRFIQRYEADCTGETAELSHPGDMPAPAIKVERMVHSPISPPSTNQEETKVTLDLEDSQQTASAAMYYVEASAKTSSDSVAPNNPKSVENGRPNGPARSNNTNHKSESGRSIKKEPTAKTDADAVSHSRTAWTPRPPSSSHSSSSSASSARRSRVQKSEAPPTPSNPRRRRMAAINGNLLAMVAVRAHRSTSSSSSGSSSSSSRSCIRLRKARRGRRQSAEDSDTVSAAEQEEGEGEECSSSTPSRQYRQHVQQQQERQERKTKRAAALLASAATLGAKRPRLSKQSKKSGVASGKARVREFRSKDDSSERRNLSSYGGLLKDEGEDKDDEEMTSVSTNEDSGKRTADGKKVVSSTPVKCVGTELSSVNLENSRSLEDLADQLPGPPDCEFMFKADHTQGTAGRWHSSGSSVAQHLSVKQMLQLTRHSLYLPHSLEHYKSSQTTFIQLVSCNDQALKQVPKCRACRQLKGVPHFEADLPAPSGITYGDSDVESVSSNTNWSLSRLDLSSGSQEASIASSNSRQEATANFKRPSSARHPSSHRSDRDRRRTKAFVKSPANLANASSGSAETGDKSSGKPERGKQRRVAALSPSSVFCRFWGFRKLCFNNREVLKIADFCQSSEASLTDRSLWEMHFPVSPTLDLEAARYILERAGTLLCHLLRQELMLLTGKSEDESAPATGCKLTALPHSNSRPKNGVRRHPEAGSRVDCSIAWKRPVKGVREMCDVCETALFNTHWVCAKCGYSVCVHCCDEAKARLRNPNKSTNRESELEMAETDASPGGDKYLGGRSKQGRARAGPPGWVSCTTTRQNHDPGRLMLTTLLPATTVSRLLHRLHRIANRFQIRLNCRCPPDHYLARSLLPVQSNSSLTRDVSRGDNSLNLLASIALKSNDLKTSQSPNEDDEEGPGKKRSEPTAFCSWIYKPHPGTNCLSIKLKNTPTGIKSDPSTSNTTTSSPVDTVNAEPKQGVSRKYRVLRLSQPNHSNNLEAFQREWRRSHPVIVSGCQTNFDPKLWSPQRFAEDFGQLRTVLVDCATGVELTRYPLRTFWDGFERKNKRLVSKDGRALCLKLKDWPTMDDFAELQPERFQDLMSHLPLPVYTGRDGQLNLASRLPAFFVCPDLGPKLYVAYGTGGCRSMGTTNLHVDIADAVNVLLYVGHPVDSVEESTANAEAVLTVIRQANVDTSFIDRTIGWMRRSLQVSSAEHSLDSERGCTNYPPECGPPGALWHIFLPGDMPTLRDFLTRITEEETGAPLEAGSDPIHDQQIYLDQPLLDRLYACTGVLPCTLVQFHGDAVFIPAGAAHQVRNLNSCIKAAVDFVSPEHLNRCLQLSEQFRRLSATHQNREDKLQAKNMLFHGVKDALSVLLMSSGGDRKTQSDEKDSVMTTEHSRLGSGKYRVGSSS